MPIRQCICVQHDLFRLLQRAALAREDRVLFALLETGIVIIIIALVGHRHVGLLETSFDFLKETFLEFPGMRHLFGSIFVFIIQILDDLGILPLAQPIIVIHSDVAMLFEQGGYLFRHSNPPPSKCDKA